MSLPFPKYEEPEESGFFFGNEDISFKLTEEDSIQIWLQEVVAKEGKTLGQVTYVYCSDAFLHDYNLRFLQHDDLTDVITFPYDDTQVSGDVYISIDRVRENATIFKVPFEHELHRVMVHGLLHLMGYEDQTLEAKKGMKALEDAYLALFKK